MKLSTIMKRPDWNEDKVRYFLTNKPLFPNGKLRNDINWPRHHIEQMEKTPQFALLNNLDLKGIQQLQFDIETQFSEQTESFIENIVTIPHNYELSDTDLPLDKGMIMVDASLKKNGHEKFAGVAGCIRNSNGNIICGFSKEIKEAETSEENMDVSRLELKALQEGIEVARVYGMKNYSLISDCMGNVLNIYKLLQNFQPLNRDYLSHRDIFNKIAQDLKEDNAQVGYVPRQYNNIADEFSKSYQKRIAQLFTNGHIDIKKYSESVLSQEIELNSQEQIYFYHPKQYNHNIHQNPYDMDKNLHLQFSYDHARHPVYEKFVCPIVNISTKKNLTIFYFLVDPINLEFTLLKEDKNYTKERVLGNELLISSLTEHFKQLKNDKIGLILGPGMNAIINRLAPVRPKELSHWQNFYKSCENMDEFGVFLISNPLKNKLHKWISEYNEEHKIIPSKLKYR